MNESMDIVRPFKEFIKDPDARTLIDRYEKESINNLKEMKGISISEPEKIEKIPKDSESALKEDFSELKARFDSANLTKTEIKIAEKIALGKSDKEIAKELQISPSTVAVHNKKIFKKLNIHSRKELSQ